MGESPHALPDPDFDDGGAAEGAVFLRTHLRRERDTKLRRRKLDEARKLGRSIACEACGFDFFETYGDRGSDYIEYHHRTPRHVTGPVKTQLKDLALICSNCHRMIHRSTPWMTVEALCDLVHSRRNGTGVVAG